MIFPRCPKCGKRIMNVFNREKRKENLCIGISAYYVHKRCPNGGILRRFKVMRR